jgi:hypothetical protein
MHSYPITQRQQLSPIETTGYELDWTQDPWHTLDTGAQALASPINLPDRARHHRWGHGQPTLSLGP